MSINGNLRNHDKNSGLNLKRMKDLSTSKGITLKLHLNKTLFFVCVRNKARKASVKRPSFEGILMSYSLTFIFNARGASPLNIGIPLKKIIICFGLYVFEAVSQQVEISSLTTRKVEM